MGSLRVLVLSLVVVIAQVPAVNGWWQEGHYLVAEIAYQSLNATERKFLDDYLAEDQLWGFCPNMVECSAWADDIKEEGMLAFSAWHYVNTPFVPPGGNVTPPALPEVNLEWALETMQKSFVDPEGVFGSRSFALRMLIHLIGDAHQPLHAITLFDLLFPTGDRGGNSFIVYYPGRTNLHTIWDSGAFAYDTTLSQPLTPDQRTHITSLASSLMANHPSPPASSLAFEPSVWLAESYKKGQIYGYLNGTLQNGTQLTDEYANSVVKICNESIALGGYRLAYMLRDAINRIPPPPAAWSPGLAAGVAVAGCAGLAALLIVIGLVWKRLYYGGEEASILLH